MQVHRIENNRSYNTTSQVKHNIKEKQLPIKNNLDISFKGLSEKSKYLAGALSTFFAGILLPPLCLISWAFTYLFIKAANECDDEDIRDGSFKRKYIIGGK